ncbi:MAG: ABC transporter substrate-binding protein [Acidocella sp.]|nr:ABC transporter substrate-binding protein [Acidocella sp.]
MTSSKSLPRRRLFSLAAASLAAPAILRASPKPLRAGVYKGQDKTLLPLAGQADFPYPVQYFEFSSGQLIIEAINAGALDYGSWSEIPQAFAAAGRAQVRAIAVLRGDVNDQVVLVRKDAGISSIAGLKGKRVGYVRATTSHYYLLRMLWQAGLDFTDIQAINLSPTDGAAAFAAGDLDAWAIYGYPIYEALAAGHAEVLRTAQGILSGNYLLGASLAALADSALRASIVDYVGRVGRTYGWAEANKPAWSKALAQTIQVKQSYIDYELYHESQPERLTKLDDGVVASTQAVADTFSKAGLLPTGVDVKPYFDYSII